MTLTPEWLSAATALAAVVIGPVIAVLTTRAQVRASLLTARHQATAGNVVVSRQAWINTLRDSVSEYLATASELSHLASKGAWVDDSRNERLIHLRSRIALLINPTEDDHKRLLSLVDQMLGLIGVEHDDAWRASYTTVQHELTAQTQRVLKREWEVVKRGEPLERGSAASRPGVTPN